MALKALSLNEYLHFCFQHYHEGGPQPITNTVSCNWEKVDTGLQGSESYAACQNTPGSKPVHAAASYSQVQGCLAMVIHGRQIHLTREPPT